MKYSHTGIFVPKGTKKTDSDTNTKKSTIKTNNPIPSNQEQADLNVQLQKEINAYSARNYWELSSILTTYENPPWNTITEVEKTLRDMTRPHGRIRKRTKDTKFIGFQHRKKHNHNDIKQKLLSEYDIDISDKQIEQKTSTVSRFYITWRTEVN